MSEHFILALDQGTSSSRAVLFDVTGTPLGIEQQEFRQLYPQPGWVEHDPFEIWQTQRDVLQRLLVKRGIAPSAIAAIGITNQRETTVLWERETGRPVANAIVWQDRRTAPLCEELKRAGHETLVRDRTGLVLDAYFSGTKIRWLLDHVPDLRPRARNGDICFGTVDSWLVWNLTEGRVHATDLTNASRTLLCNIHTGQWDDDLLALLDVPRAILPEIRPSSADYGHYYHEKASIPIRSAIGDQQAALLGQACHHDGMVKNTYGTGCFLLMNTGTRPRTSRNGLLTTVACHDGKIITYALEGSVFIAGAAIQWLRDGLHLIPSAAASESIAARATHGAVVVVPAFAGLGAPYWDMDARGAIFGLTRDTTDADLVRATLESMALQTHDVLRAMEQDSGLVIPVLQVDGGACANNFLMQFQADILGIPVSRPTMVESTAFGAAALAGIHVGLWEKDALTSLRAVDRDFHPSMPETERKQRLALWHRAIVRTRGWLTP